jgi:membrane dipeptidase
MMPFLNAEGPARAEHFIAHVEHAIRVCGEDHVGVGSDNSTTPTVADETYRRTLRAFADERARRGIGAPREYEVLFVEELNEPRRMETIADRLLARGHSEARVEKILGGNWLRLFSDVWQA